TKPTCSSTVTSWSGSPATAMTSANFPGSTAPTRSAHPSRSAAFTVAAWIACIGVSPHRTMWANCFAFQPCGYTPASVPNAIFTRVLRRAHRLLLRQDAGAREHLDQVRAVLDLPADLAADLIHAVRDSGGLLEPEVGGEAVHVAVPSRRGQRHGRHLHPRPCD